jgi:hypothetical protein
MCYDKFYIYTYCHISVARASAAVAHSSSVHRLLSEASYSTFWTNGQGLTDVLSIFISLLILASRMDCVLNILFQTV